MFSPSIEEALRVALEAHEGQTRRGDRTVPYVSHPFHIALMLARWGHDETVLQAALLHDVVEDCEEWTIERVEVHFGAGVARIVDELTEDKSKTWEERKQGAIEGVSRLSTEAAAVKAIDKLHNLATLTEQLEAATDLDGVWARFRGGRERTLETARDLVEALSQRIDPRMARALQTALERLMTAAGAVSNS